MIKGIRISIILPVYNCASYVSECIGSVLRDFPNCCELIIVDDGSQDGTRDVIESMQLKRDNIQVLCNAHKGASGARNAGLDVAKGRYVAFLDCDDCLREGFIPKAISYTDSDADLYIFGIERITSDGEAEAWLVNDREYASASEFADAYIRERKLLIYSNCNKLYRLDVIRKGGLRFDENTGFGEDRLFNYGFLRYCRRIVTSSQIMLEYIQRSQISQSSRYIPGYFDRIMKPHQAKIGCFLLLSQNTSVEEKLDFIAYDLTREIDKTIDRFTAHPQEIEENIPLINVLIFGTPDPAEEPLDILIVLGSSNCGYKVEKAVEMGRTSPGIRYIVSGGNKKCGMEITEAEYMADHLVREGIPADMIFVENRAAYTKQNLEFSAHLIRKIREADSASGNARTGKYRIGIVTSAFHILRTRLLVRRSGLFDQDEITFIGAYGPNTGMDNWYCNAAGRKIVLQEYREYLKMRRIEELPYDI